MLEVIVAVVGIFVSTLVMIAGLLAFREWGDRENVNPVYPPRNDDLIPK